MTTYTATLTARKASNLYEVFKDGVLIDKRTSKGRTYSHVVLSHPSYDAALSLANDDVCKRNDVYEYRTAEQLAKLNVGDRHPSYSSSSIHVTQGNIDDALVLLTTHNSVEAYCSHRLAARLQSVANKKAEGLYDNHRAVAYSGRLDLAQRVAANWDDSIIVAITEVQEIPAGQRTEVLPGLNTCRCGCHGDYTEHSMRAGEAGRYSSEIVWC